MINLEKFQNNLERLHYRSKLCPINKVNQYKCNVSVQDTKTGIEAQLGTFYSYYTFDYFKSVLHLHPFMTFILGDQRNKSGLNFWFNNIIGIYPNRSDCSKFIIFSMLFGKKILPVTHILRNSFRCPILFNFKSRHITIKNGFCDVYEKSIHSGKYRLVFAHKILNTRFTSNIVFLVKRLSGLKLYHYQPLNNFSYILTQNDIDSMLKSNKFLNNRQIYDYHKHFIVSDPKCDVTINSLPDFEKLFKVETDEMLITIYFPSNDTNCYFAKAGNDYVFFQAC